MHKTIVSWFRLGFRFAFRWPFRVSSSTERAVSGLFFNLHLVFIFQTHILNSSVAQFRGGVFWDPLLFLSSFSAILLGDVIAPNDRFTRGGRNTFSRHRCRNLPELPRPSPPPLLHLEKTWFWDVGAKIPRSSTKMSGYGGAIFKIWTHNSKKSRFCTTTNLPLCTRKTRNTADLSPLSSVLVKHYNAHPLKIHKGLAKYFFPTPMPKPPGAPQTHWQPPPPFHLEKTWFWDIGAKIPRSSAKMSGYGSAIFKIWTKNSNKLRFCTTTNLPHCTRKTRNTADLSPLSSVLVKHYNAHPLKIHKGLAEYFSPIDWWLLLLFEKVI